MRSNALNSLRQRKNPENRLLKEAYSKLNEDDALKYLVGAMEPVEDQYNQITFGEGDRIKNQITTGLEKEGLAATYEYQGSVIKNTHIKGYSDLDILVIEKRFHTLQPPLKPTYPYAGNTVADLLQIRSICIDHLRENFWKATVDDSGAKSVKITGGSLKRNIDVVPANEYRTVRYVENPIQMYRGIDILDSHAKKTISDEPFLHGSYIDIKDNDTKGNTRKLIRLLKSLAYESEGSVTISSFDIESLVHCMENASMQFTEGYEAPLALKCWSFLKSLEGNTSLRESLEVPDKKRKIFTDGKATLGQLTALRSELESLLVDIQEGLERSFRKLAEARTRAL